MKKDFIERSVIKLQDKFGKDELVKHLNVKIKSLLIEIGALKSEIDHLSSELNRERNMSLIIGCTYGLRRDNESRYNMISFNINTRVVVLECLKSKTKNNFSIDDIIFLPTKGNNRKLLKEAKSEYRKLSK